MSVITRHVQMVEISPKQKIIFEDTTKINWEDLKLFLENPNIHPIACLSPEFSLDYTYKTIHLQGYEIQNGFFISGKSRDFFQIPWFVPDTTIFEVFSYFLRLHQS
jgi:hypothetical protein